MFDEIKKAIALERLKIGSIFLIGILGVACQSSLAPDLTAQATPFPTSTTTHLVTPSPTNATAHLETPSLPPAPTHTTTPQPTQKPSPTETLTATSIPQIRTGLAAIVAEGRQPGYPGRLTLYIIAPDGQIMKPALENVISINSFSWSPNGQKLLFSVLLADTYDIRIYMVNADGSTPIRVNPNLTGGAHESDPIWSPDGTKIAFTQSGAGEPLVHIMDIDGSNVRFLTTGVASSWSPDGQYIAFLRPDHQVGIGIGDLYIIGIDGQGSLRLVPDMNVAGPSWSPDGLWLAFWGRGKDGRKEGIYITDISGGNVTQLTSIGEAASWFPDSQHLLVVHKGKLYIVGLDGSVEEVTSGIPRALYYLYAALQPAS
ncbi:MAG: hypothetical protein AB1791_07410 [Chloroflexota bacterium]